MFHGLHEAQSHTGTRMGMAPGDAPANANVVIHGMCMRVAAWRGGADAARMEPCTVDHESTV